MKILMDIYFPLKYMVLKPSSVFSRQKHVENWRLLLVADRKSSLEMEEELTKQEMKTRYEIHVGRNEFAIVLFKISNMMYDACKFKSYKMKFERRNFLMTSSSKKDDKKRH